MVGERINLVNSEQEILFKGKNFVKSEFLIMNRNTYDAKKFSMVSSTLLVYFLMMREIVLLKEILVKYNKVFILNLFVD
jgi:hypothetical protein